MYRETNDVTSTKVLVELEIVAKSVRGSFDVLEIVAKSQNMLFNKRKNTLS